MYENIRVPPPPPWGVSLRQYLASLVPYLTRWQLVVCFQICKKTFTIEILVVLFLAAPIEKLPEKQSTYIFAYC